MLQQERGAISHAMETTTYSIFNTFYYRTKESRYKYQIASTSVTASDVLPLQYQLVALRPSREALGLINISTIHNGARKVGVEASNGMFHSWFRTVSPCPHMRYIFWLTYSAQQCSNQYT